MAKPLEFVWNTEMKCRDGVVWASFVRKPDLPVQGVVAWRVQNPDTYYMAGYDPGSGLFSVFVVTGGQPKLLKAAKLECSAKASNIIELRFAGPVIVAFCRDDRFLIVSDRTINAPGYVGWVANQGLKSPLVRFSRLKTVEGSYVPTLVSKVVDSVERTPWSAVLVTASFGAVTMAVVGKMASAWASEEGRIEEQNSSFVTRLDQVVDEYSEMFDKAIHAITEEEINEQVEEEEIENEDEEDDEEDDDEDEEQNDEENNDDEDDEEE